jgi:dynamin 1-like protein
MLLFLFLLIGTDAADNLLNRVIPLKLGYFGLVLRSQKDIMEEKDIKVSLKAEEVFFLNHHAYQSFSEKCGTAFLCKRLSGLLLSHIQTAFPQIRNQIQNMLLKNQKELIKYGVSVEEQVLYFDFDSFKK